MLYGERNDGKNISFTVTAVTVVFLTIRFRFRQFKEVSVSFNLVPQQNTKLKWILTRTQCLFTFVWSSSSLIFFLLVPVVALSPLHLTLNQFVHRQKYTNWHTTHTWECRFPLHFLLYFTTTVYVILAYPFTVQRRVDGIDACSTYHHWKFTLHITNQITSYHTTERHYELQ